MTVNVTTRQLLKGVELLLLVAILGLVLWSQPWKNTSGDQRKITVTGEATIEAVPDEYTFSPYFEATGTDQEAMKEQISTQANAAVDRLKELGVPEDDLKLDVSSFDRWFWREGEEGTLTASLTITARDTELVQKIQDYLLNTEAKGQLSPQATFSDAKKKELDSQAVEKAIQDAKTKAGQQASIFGDEVGDVLEVSQAQDSVFPIAYDMAVSRDGAESSASSVPVLPGKNEYTQQVTVTYALQ